MTQTNKEFESLCKEIFNTWDGKRLLSHLKMSFVDISSVADTPELTYYRLGQKELVQMLIETVYSKRDLYQLTEELLFDERVDHE